MPPRSYRTNLRTAVAAAAAPYGYTLTIWTSGAVLTHERGLPRATDAMTMFLGAVLAFLLVGLIAYGGFVLSAPAPPRHQRLWGSFHLGAVGLPLLAVVAIAELVRNAAAWPIASFTATAIFLVVLAAQFTIAESRARLPPPE